MKPGIDRKAPEAVEKFRKDARERKRLYGKGPSRGLNAVASALGLSPIEEEIRANRDADMTEDEIRDRGRGRT